jgi:hypothetical protein
MILGGSNDWVYWQQSILFGVQASSPQMYQVIISWISGALLPVVALGMTALVANNIKLMSDENIQPNTEIEPTILDKIEENEDVELKKAQEPLLNEDEQVPNKPRRHINPLFRKGTTKKITSQELDELYKPSNGDEVIKMIEDAEKQKDNDLLNTNIKDVQNSSELTHEQSNTPYLENGVEVIDGKAISKNKKLNKFGMHSNPEIE